MNFKDIKYRVLQCFLIVDTAREVIKISFDENEESMEARVDDRSMFMI